jgi:HlyD family secretion protein
MTQNVVTYTVVVNTDNSDGLLLPYLTANVQFEVSHRENVLMVPTSALRWRPQPTQVVPEAREAFVQSTRRREAAKEGGQAKKKRDGSKRELPSVWVEEEGFVRPVQVQTGLSDGIRAEVTSDELKEGTRVVIGEQRRNEEGTATKNPFLPSFLRGSSKNREQKGQ